MFSYKCDKCGRSVNVDPGEPRICDECQERMNRAEQATRIQYQAKRREVCHAG